MAAYVILTIAARKQSNASFAFEPRGAHRRAEIVAARRKGAQVSVYVARTRNWLSRISTVPRLNRHGNSTRRGAVAAAVMLTRPWTAGRSSAFAHPAPLNGLWSFQCITDEMWIQSPRCLFLSHSE